MLHKRRGTIIAGIGLLLIAVLTLTPDLEAGTRAPSLCLICGRRGGEDAFLNVMLFIPFAFGLRLRGTTRWRAWLIATVLTATVEILQTFIPGRDSTLGDVLMNSSGALVGTLPLDSWGILVFPSAKQARALLLSGSALWLLLVALGGWAMRPWIPSGPYIAQLAPDLLNIELFAGHVLDARLDGRTIVPNVSLTSSDAIRDSLLRGTLTLQARVVPAGPTYDLAPIISIASPEESEVVVLGQAWDNAVLRVRLHSGELRMNTPAVASPRAIRRLAPSAAATDVIALRGEIVGGRELEISSESRHGRSVAKLALNPFLLWSLVTPGEFRSTRAFGLESCLWVAVLFLPLGYWAGRWKLQRVAPPDTSFAVFFPEILLASVIIAGHAAVPLLFSFPVAGVALWVTAILASAGALLFAAHWKQ